jgi:hypothetical protein
LLNDAPLENEPGHSKISKEFMPYQKSIEFSNINFAVCDIINRNKRKIPYPFEIFYPFMKESFLKHYDKMMEFVESKKEDVSTQVVTIYSMNTSIDYGALKTKLMDTKMVVDSEQ